jgi:endonuclease/exonuclease/phosphatase (EEP) superfamily protein YafD
MSRSQAPVKSPRSWRRQAAKLLCAAVAAGALIVSWAVTGNPERHAATALLQYLPFVVYLVPAVFALLASFWLGWRWRCLALASVVLVLVVPMGLCVGSPDEGHGHVRFMSYNAKTMHSLGRRNGYGDLAHEVFTQDPDVLVMQDADTLMYHRQAKPELFKAVFGGRQVYAFGQYVVVSRFPLRDCAPGWIPFRGATHSYVHCVLEAHGKEIDLVTVHLLTPRSGLNAVRHERLSGLGDWQENMLDRLEQARQLAADVSRMARPRIVAGDLNAPEASSVVRLLLDTGLRDAYSSASVGYGYTYGHEMRLGFPFLRIDHVLVSDEIGVARAFVGGGEASEHRPVIADLRVNRD